jgi:hypothetical protein
VADARAWEVVVDPAGDIALEAADDLAFAESFGGAALDVVAGGLVVPHADDRNDVERAVGRSVTAAAESVTTGGPSAARWLSPAHQGPLPGGVRTTAVIAVLGRKAAIW